MGFMKRLHDDGIHENDFKPDVIIIDPIYKLCHGDPSKGEVALAIIRFSDMLYNKFNCTNILIHHNVKDSYGQDGNKIKKDDSFYGHSFIKNHIRTSYSMSSTGELTRQLKRHKGRGNDTRKLINMIYDPETHLLHSDDSGRRSGEAIERILSFIDECKQNDKKTNAQEVCNECDISYSRLRHLKSNPLILSVVKFSKSSNPSKPELWIPI
jgi:RecA-family ATPase